MDRYSNFDRYVDRYSQPDFWTQDASRLTGEDWLFFVSIAAAIVLVRVIIVGRRNAEVQRRRDAWTEERLNIAKEMRDIYGGRRR